MGIRTYNPYTPSRRQMTGSDFSEITKTTPEKSLLDSKKRKAGRNAQGKITVRHRGGGIPKRPAVPSDRSFVLTDALPCIFCVHYNTWMELLW